METNEIYDIFGLEAPEEEAPEEPAEVAEEDPELEEESAPETESADEYSEDEGENEDEPADHPMDKDERRRQAAARRKREFDEAIAKAKEEAKAEFNTQLSEILKQTGLENPLEDGKAIESLDDLIAYNKSMQDRQLDRTLRRTGLSREEFDELIEQSPVVQAARRYEEQARRAEEAERASRARDNINRVIEEEIYPYAPDVRNIDDLMKLPEADDILERVSRGMTVSEAYFNLHREEMLNRSATLGRKQAARSAAGRSHLRSTAQQGAGARAVPSGQMEIFRRMNPTATEEEITKFFNKFKE